MGTYIVYKHTSADGKVYIGITKQNPSKRWKNGLGYEDNGRFYNAIKKYGWNSFKHEILYDSLTAEEAALIEKRLIQEYKSYDRRYGYNLTFGGEENCPTSETKSKISESVKNVWASEEYKTATSEKMIGVKRSNASREAMSVAQKKRFERIEERQRISERQRGKTRSEEAKRKTRESLKKYYSSPENLQKAREAQKKSIEAIKKRVKCIDTGEVFESVRDAALAKNICHQNISAVCKGRRKKAAGSRWEYV